MNDTPTLEDLFEGLPKYTATAIKSLFDAHRKEKPNEPLPCLDVLLSQDTKDSEGNTVTKGGISEQRKHRVLSQEEMRCLPVQATGGIYFVKGAPSENLQGDVVLVGIRVNGCVKIDVGENISAELTLEAEPIIGGKTEVKLVDEGENQEKTEGEPNSAIVFSKNKHHCTETVAETQRREFEEEAEVEDINEKRTYTDLFACAGDLGAIQRNMSAIVAHKDVVAGSEKVLARYQRAYKQFIADVKARLETGEPLDEKTVKGLVKKLSKAAPLIALAYVLKKDLKRHVASRPDDMSPKKFIKSDTSVPLTAYDSVTGETLEVFLRSFNYLTFDSHNALYF